jgi:hypothetical protein
MKDFKIMLEYDSDYGELVITDMKTKREIIEGEIDIVGDVLDCLEDALNEEILG